MIIRDQYMAKGGDKLHHEYYLQIANDLGMQLSREMVARCRAALDNGDKHLNTIPIREWDVLVGRYLRVERAYGFSSEMSHIGTPARTAEVFARYGDTASISGVTSALKNMAIHQAKNDK